MNNNLDAQQIQLQQQLYIPPKKNNNVHPSQPNFNLNQPSIYNPYILHNNNNNNYNNNMTLSPHTLNLHTNGAILNTNPHIAFSSSYQSLPFPILPTYPNVPLNVMTNNNINNNIQPQYSNPQVLRLINPTTLRINNTNNNNININAIHTTQNTPNIMKKNNQEKESNNENNQEDFDDNSSLNSDIKLNNPWFNDEIASIVKLHRKTARKYHRSKTKPKELKQLCKKLEKKKRKLIRDAKEKYMKELISEKYEKTQSMNNLLKVNQQHEKQQTNVQCEQEKDDYENIFSTSGNIPFDVLSLIYGIYWTQYWTSGNHWKIDVDELLESTNDEQEMHSIQWINTIKNAACEHWVIYLNTWKNDINEILQSM